ncbi:hypothetical protein EJB05_47470, partial [Eragrostis curvula]
MPRLRTDRNLRAAMPPPPLKDLPSRCCYRTWPMPDGVSLNSYKFLVSEEHKFLVLHTLWLELLEKIIVSLLGALYIGSHNRVTRVQSREHYKV